MVVQKIFKHSVCSVPNCLLIKEDPKRLPFGPNLSRDIGDIEFQSVGVSGGQYADLFSYINNPRLCEVNLWLNGVWLLFG